MNDSAMIEELRNQIRTVEKQIQDIKIMHFHAHARYKSLDMIDFRNPGCKPMVGIIEGRKVDDYLETIKYIVRRRKKDGSPLDRVVNHPVEVKEENVIGIFKT